MVCLRRRRKSHISNDVSIAVLYPTMSFVRRATRTEVLHQLPGMRPVNRRAGSTVIAECFKPGEVCVLSVGVPSCLMESEDAHAVADGAKITREQPRL
jgi:hypothetical protein